MLRRAIREQWPITPAQRQAAMEFLARVVAQGDAKSGVAAVQALIAADNVNTKREHSDTQADAAEQRAVRDAIRALLADPSRAAALLGGLPPPPQLTPPSDDTPNGTTEHPTS